MKDDELSQLYNIAVMYYEEKLTQDEIAKKQAFLVRRFLALLLKQYLLELLKSRLFLQSQQAYWQRH